MENNRVTLTGVITRECTYSHSMYGEAFLQTEIVVFRKSGAMDMIPFYEDINMFGVYHDIFDKDSLGFVDSEFHECETVVAWMPLPDPYKDGD